MSVAILAIKTSVSSVSSVVLRFNHGDTWDTEEARRLLEAGSIFVLCARHAQFARGGLPRRGT
jgi:hypothetical protein